MADDSDTGPNELAVLVKDSKRSNKVIDKKGYNNDGGGDSSDSEMPTPDISQRQSKPPVKKVGIPMLNVKNLGFSNLIGANGKTQEENDVDSTVKVNQLMQSKELFKKIDAPQSEAEPAELSH